MTPEPHHVAADLLGNLDIYAVANWDGEDSEPISNATLLRAREISAEVGQVLGMPRTAPGANGSFGMVWDSELHRVYVVIIPGGRVQVYVRRKIDEGRSETVMSSGTVAREVKGHILLHLVEMGVFLGKAFQLSKEEEDAILALLKGIPTPSPMQIVTQRAEQAERRAERLQAKVDALMLEYCPDEMTPEQLAEWEKHQRAVPAEFKGE